MINVNLDKELFMADSIDVQLDSATLLFVDATSGMYNDNPYWKINVSLHGGSYSFPCSQEVYQKVSSLTRGQRISLVLSVNLRYKKIKAVDIG